MYTLCCCVLFAVDVDVCVLCKNERQCAMSECERDVRVSKKRERESESGRDTVKD